MDFVHDQLIDGRPIRMLTVVDQLSRQCPLIEIVFSFSGEKVAAALERLVMDTGSPVSITVDHELSSPWLRLKNGRIAEA
jgi:putative transposase